MEILRGCRAAAQPGWGPASRLRVADGQQRMV